MNLKKRCSSLLILSLLLSGTFTTNMNALSVEEISNEQSTEIESEYEVKDTISDVQKDISENGFKFEENKNLSLDEMQQRMLEIDKKYEVNDLLSESDSEFMIGYYNTLNESLNNNYGISTLATSNQKLTTTTLKTSKKTVSGVTAQLSGSIWTSTSTTMLNPNNSFGGTIKLQILGGASKVKKVQGVIHCSGYGVIGSNGIVGKVADEKISETWVSAPFASHTIIRKKPYTGVILYTSTYAQMIVTTNTTSFDLP